MHRRTFFSSLTKSAIALPFLTSAAQSLSGYKETRRGGLFVGDYKPVNKGLGFGVSKLDTFIKGVREGELAALYSPLYEVSCAMLINAALYGSMKQTKAIDYVTSFDNARFYMEKALNRTTPAEKDGILASVFAGPERGRLLRIHTLTVGEPSRTGWDMYREKMSVDPPDAILIDDIGLHEKFHGDRGMARGLKELALGLSVPVVVIAPIDDAAYQKESILRPRKDFKKHADVNIMLNPRAITMHCENSPEYGRYLFLQMTLISNSIEGERTGYALRTDIGFNEWYGEFG